MKRISYLLLFLSISVFGQERITENVKFKSGKHTITGILVKPNIQGKLPAVVFQQGSGNFSFDGYETEAWGPHKFYIEDVLLKNGYAILYCNKRGLGGSSGNWRKNSFEGRATDANAAVTYLQSREDILTSKIGISGHSQGGWIAQLAASNNKEIAFVIALAGPTVGVNEQMLKFIEHNYKCKGIYGKKLARKLRKAQRSRNFSAFVGRVFPFIGGAKHWSLIKDYKPHEAISKLTCPTLLLFGEYDAHVDPKESISRLKSLFNGNVPENFDVRIMQKGQHGFYEVNDPCTDWETATQQPFSNNFKNEIDTWVKALK